MRRLKHTLTTAALLTATLAIASDPTAQQKAPVPDAETRRAVKKAAADIYGDRFRQAKTPAAKTALAKEMLEAASKVGDGSADQYVLLSIARDVAAGAGNVQTALDAVEKLARRFDVPGAKLKAEALTTAARHASTSTQRKAVAEAASGVIDALIATDDYPAAIGLCETARSAAQKARQYKLVKSLSARVQDLKEQEAVAKAYRDATAVLDKDPTDPAANLAAGRYLCFVKGDWDRGVAMLALGGNGKLKETAIKELRGASTAEEQAALGDAWWALAEKKGGQEKESLMLRAGSWYQQAEPGLAGLARVKTEKRLAVLAKLGREIPESSGGPPPAVAPFDAKKAKGFQLRWARHLGLPVEWTNSIGMKFVLIPPGEFMMGSPEAERQAAIQEARAANDKWAIDRIPTEGPQHRVKITRPFYLGKCEVTQAQWQAVMGGNPSRFQAPTSPVEQVSWDDIQPFLAKLNVAGTRRVPSAKMKYALPTEAQWEYACRSGTTTAFCFGDNAALLSEYGWFKDNAGGRTHPVGQKRPNAWGLHDMYGNVWEWCADRWATDYYAQSPPTDPVGPPTGSGRVHRGGSWGSHAGGCRSAHRGGHSPDNRDYYLGFRLASVLVDK